MNLNKHKMNNEELNLWRTMQRELKEHNSHYVRKEFYPHNMDKWESQHKNIENKYRKMIFEMQRKRINFEKNELCREEIMAVEALIMMKNSKEKLSIEREKRKVKKQKKIYINNLPRRSSRLAKKEKITFEF